MYNLKELYELRAESREYGDVPVWLEERIKVAEALAELKTHVRAAFHRARPYLIGTWLVLLIFYLLNPFGVFR